MTGVARKAAGLRRLVYSTDQEKIDVKNKCRDRFSGNFDQPCFLR